MPTANDDSLKYQERELGWVDQGQLLILATPPSQG